MRGGAMRPFSNFPTDSSLGAMMGSRSGRFPEAWARRFCITRLVTVIRLTGCLGQRSRSVMGSGCWVLYRRTGLEHTRDGVGGGGGGAIYQLGWGRHSRKRGGRGEEISDEVRGEDEIAGIKWR